MEAREELLWLIIERQLDDIPDLFFDEEVLDYLKEQGPATLRDIGREFHVPMAKVLEARRRLEEEGRITSKRLDGQPPKRLFFAEGAQEAR